MLLEEYIGLGREDGGWVGHVCRWLRWQARLHLPFSKPKKGEKDEAGIVEERERHMTPQDQEDAFAEEIAEEERQLREDRERAGYKVRDDD